MKRFSCIKKKKGKIKRDSGAHGWQRRAQTHDVKWTLIHICPSLQIDLGNSSISQPVILTLPLEKVFFPLAL